MIIWMMRTKPMTIAMKVLKYNRKPKLIKMKPIILKKLENKIWSKESTFTYNTATSSPRSRSSAVSTSYCSAGCTSRSLTYRTSRQRCFCTMARIRPREWVNLSRDRLPKLKAQTTEKSAPTKPPLRISSCR